MYLQMVNYFLKFYLQLIITLHVRFLYIYILRAMHLETQLEYIDIIYSIWIVDF